ncbi:MAG: 4a-hydroxytetrahydrobiopterin dehydratase [Kiritimatiellia bacterium]
MNDSSPPCLPPEEIDQALQSLPGWSREAHPDRILKEFSFKNYHRTLAFVNAVAWIAHRMDHHPDLEVSYSRCRVFYSTHSAGGITEKDLEAARRIEAL